MPCHIHHNDVPVTLSSPYGLSSLVVHFERHSLLQRLGAAAVVFQYEVLLEEVIRALGEERRIVVLVLAPS
jgi:hypothetical protein